MLSSLDLKGLSFQDGPLDGQTYNNQRCDCATNENREYVWVYACGNNDGHYILVDSSLKWVAYF
jgi:hypothetical protein